MAEKQPETLVEGATTGDVEDEIPAAKSAEDRKAAAALSKLDARGDDGAAPSREMDREAMSRAMHSLGGDAGKKPDEKKELKRVKVEPADVELLVDQLELSKAKATELLKAHEGDAVRALGAFVTAN